MILRMSQRQTQSQKNFSISTRTRTHSPKKNSSVRYALLYSKGVRANVAARANLCGDHEIRLPVGQRGSPPLATRSFSILLESRNDFYRLVTMEKLATIVPHLDKRPVWSACIKVDYEHVWVMLVILLCFSFHLFGVTSDSCRIQVDDWALLGYGSGK